MSQAELGADADALVSSVAAAVAELKAKHARAAAEALEAEEGRQATGTREHAQALTLGLEEATAAAEATVQVCQVLGDWSRTLGPPLFFFFLCELSRALLRDRCRGTSAQEHSGNN